MKKSNLEVRILAVNTLNQYAKAIIDHEVNHFRQFVGLDILKTDLSIKKKFQHESLPEFSGILDDGTHFCVNYWIECSQYSFRINIKSCVNGGSYEDRSYFCEYYKDVFYPFDFRDGILCENVNEQANRIEQLFNETDLLIMAEEVKKLEKEYSEKLANIPHQFREVMDIRRLSY
jgi:hypothetical protein